MYLILFSSMSRIFVVLLLYFSVFTALSQSVPRLRKLGNQHFEATQYIDAIKYYEKLIGLDRRDMESTFRLATSYHKTLNFEKAKTHFSEVIKAQDSTYAHLASYQYGNILKLQGYFSTASEVFKAIIAKPNVDSYLLELARKQKEGCQLAIDYEKKERGYVIEEMEEVNSTYHDFGATINPINQSLVFVTTRNLHDNQYEAIQYGGLLPDLIQFTKKNKRWSNTSSKNKFDRLNTEWAEGSGSFTGDGKAFYFTSCKSGEGADCKIMVSRLVDARWSTPEPLNDYVNLPDTENKHPFITASEDTLFFASNRPGGYGGSDIWMSMRGEGYDTWTPCINLGDIINTVSNEITPYYSSAFECLLFASDGHVGYGGYDIFAVKGESFFEPEIYNLGAPFNSPLDDTYFSIAEGSGFLSSNRTNHENLNLYTFSVPNEKLYLSLLISGESLIDQRIVARYRNVRSLDLVTFRIEDHQGFEIFDPVKKKKETPSLIQDSPYRKTDSMALPIGGSSLIATAEEDIVSEESDIILVSNYQNSNYISTSAEDPGQEIYLSREIPKRPKVRIQNQQSLPSELANLQRFEYEKLYFKFGSSVINYNTQLALKSLIEQLRSQEQALKYIQIISNTDDVGTAGYNMDLSQDRGQSIKNYLVSKGVSSDRIIITARGESNPVSKGTTWYHRQFNRRAEIVVYADNPIKLNSSRLVVLRKEMTLEEAADRLSMPFQKLKALNQLYNETLQKGQVIRTGDTYASFSLEYFLDETDVKFNFFPYKVQEGETIASVASKFKTPEELLVEINQLESDLVQGDEIYVYNFSF